MTQCERLYNRLQVCPVTPMSAWNDLGIYRLASRIHDLKNQGYNIKAQIVAVTNRHGETCKVAEYSMGAE